VYYSAAGAERSRPRWAFPGATCYGFHALEFWSCGVRISLLPRPPFTDERGDGHHPAIHRAGLGGCSIRRRAERRAAVVRRIAAVGLAVVGCALAVRFCGLGGFRMDAVGVMADVLAAFSFAFYNVGGHSVLAVYDAGKSTLGAGGGVQFWIFVNPPWKILPLIKAGSSGEFMLVFFACFPCLGHFRVTSRACKHLEPLAPSWELPEPGVHVS